MKSKIRDGFYLGGYEDALAVLQGSTQGITHVLTVTDALGLAAAEKGLLKATKVVPFTDSDFENLLDRLDECLNFIDEALQDDGAALLVHCTVGVSRSASVVIAYLMRKEHLTADAALQEVQRLRPQANPNPGFLRQLKMFEAMGCKVDKSSMAYKLFRTKELRRALIVGNHLSSSQFAAATEDDGTELVRCRACNWVAASASNLVHRPTSECCGAIFVEPLQWMTETITDLDRDEGDLVCVGCGNLLGKYSWDELPCSCGAMLMPAFQLNTYKTMI